MPNLNYRSTLQSNNEALNSNNLDLQSLIEQANSLPDAGGVELPELTNEGSASDLMLGKELIDADGSKVTGTFSIDSELITQDDLIAQIQAAVDSLPEAGSGSGGSASYDTCTLQINNQSSEQPKLAYTSIENGKIVAKYLTIYEPYSVTSITCLCGSVLNFYSRFPISSSSIIYIGSMESSYSRVYGINASANEIIAIIVESSGGGGN